MPAVAFAERFQTENSALPSQKYENTPRLTELDRNTSLFGIGHLGDINIAQWIAAGEYKLFRSKIIQADHIVMESYSRMKPYYLTRGSSFEANAIKLYEKKGKTSIHFLEDGTNLLDLGSKYKLNPHFIAALQMMDSIFAAIESSTTPVALETAVSGIIEGYTSLSVGTAELDKTTLKEYIRSFRANIEHLSRFDNPDVKGFNETLDASRAVALWYMGRVRDFEVIAPTWRSLRERLDGKMVTVIGDTHIPDLVKTYNGESLDEPPSWADFLDAIPPDEKEKTLKVQRMMLEVIR